MTVEGTWHVAAVVVSSCCSDAAGTGSDCDDQRFTVLSSCAQQARKTSIPGDGHSRGFD